MDEITCGLCNGPTEILGTLGNVTHFRCRNCGTTGHLEPLVFDLPVLKPLKVEPPERFHIYGKHQTQRMFAAMDLSRCVRTKNLFYATLLTKEEADKFMTREAPRNPDWKFEVRKA
jgi:hypothetical protein